MSDMYFLIDFILELCPNGDLLEFMNLQEGGRLSEDVARFYLSEIVATLEFIHSKSVYYRDLKLENILLDENYHCKICDFNTSSKLAALTDTVGSIAGTAEYVPPELIIDQKAGLSYACGLYSTFLLYSRF
jgi:serine/threonine protein kinase